MTVHEETPFAFFDDEAKRALEKARRHAERAGSPTIGPEHLLMALQGAEEAADNGPARSPAHMNLTPSCEDAITNAARMAQAAGDDHIGVDHLRRALGQERGVRRQ